MKRVVWLVVADVDEAEVPRRYSSAVLYPQGPEAALINEARSGLECLHGARAVHIDADLIPALAQVTKGIAEREESIYDRRNAEEVLHAANALVDWTETVWP